ncbi:MAG: hypothetical protein EBV31_07545, partial [Verrucomicrobia bacterium]|nr:hypothetical protein [Verrucomicrobiota bacterium]
MDSLFPYLVLDVVTIVAVILVMFHRMTFWHPLTAYLFFHVYSFTYRGTKLASGSVSPLYTGIPNAEVITPDEISRALLWADVGLVIFALAAWLAHLQFDAKAERPTVRRVLNPNIAKTLGVLCLPVGLYFFYAVIGLLFFGGVALQGYHRFMLVLPLLFFAAYYLQSRRLRWPTWPILVVAILLGLIFPRLKYIGQAVQNGDNQEAIAQVVESFTFTSQEKGESSSEDFLDQYAGALSLADTNERKFWGSTYLAIITLPIPRAWWPNKPGLADHLQEISTSGRNYVQEGRIITYLAESYLNFGYAGFFVIPALMGYVLTTYCLHATLGPMRRLGRYVYLVAFMALVQTFRDGLLSIFVFTLVHNMPMLFALVLHLVPGFADKSLDR